MVDDPIVEVEQRSALKSVPSALFAGAVADFVRRELRERGGAWTVRATQQPNVPEYVVWPHVEVERDDGVRAAITCRPGYGVERRTELLDPHPGRRPEVRSAAVTREPSVHNLSFLVFGSGRLRDVMVLVSDLTA
jgi:hypothetical protein